MMSRGSSSSKRTKFLGSDVFIKPVSLRRKGGIPEGLQSSSQAGTCGCLTVFSVSHFRWDLEGVTEGADNATADVL